MKKIIFTYTVMASLLVSCNGNTDHNATDTETSITEESLVVDTAKEVKVINRDCKEGESLVYESETFASYTEDTMRGQGVVSFTMDINDRLDILNEDETNFCEIVLNENMTFFTLTMPKKVIARKVITNYDFAAFDFDSENINSDKDYLLIYINKEKKKVKKADVKFTYTAWEDYIEEQSIKLKDCNLLTDASGKTNPKSKELVFTVTEVNGDEIKIKSNRDCLDDGVQFQDAEGRIKWKSGNTLIVDFAVCN